MIKHIYQTPSYLLNKHINFPVTLPYQWQTAERSSIPNAYLKNWLLDTGSLTERLQAHSNKFDLQLIGQRQIAPELEEGALLCEDPAVIKQQDWQIREVVLIGNDQPWVFARSIIPQALCERDLAALGNRPLGKILFNDVRFKRQPFELMHLSDGTDLLGKLNIKGSSSLWGRRSIFQFKHYHLMVAEVFLPQAPAYMQLEPKYHVAD